MKKAMSTLCQSIWFQLPVGFLGGGFFPSPLECCCCQKLVQQSSLQTYFQCQSQGWQSSWAWQSQPCTSIYSFHEYASHCSTPVDIRVQVENHQAKVLPWMFNLAKPRPLLAKAYHKPLPFCFTLFLTSLSCHHLPQSHWRFTVLGSSKQRVMSSWN